MNALHVDALIRFLNHHIHALERNSCVKRNERIQRELRYWKKVQRLAKKILRLYDGG